MPDEPRGFHSARAEEALSTRGPGAACAASAPLCAWQLAAATGGTLRRPVLSCRKGWCRSVTKAQVTALGSAEMAVAPGAGLA